MKRFVMNGVLWRIRFAHPASPMLIDRTGESRLATTDPNQRTIFLSDELQGELLTTVLIHELGHCALFSFGLIDDIHRVVDRRFWVEAEEWVCNFIADYGRSIFLIASSFLGADALRILPSEIEKLIA